MASRRFKLSQDQLFAAIFFEFAEALGDRISSERLIEAANQLAKLIEKDFGLGDEDRLTYRFKLFFS